MWLLWERFFGWYALTWTPANGDLSTPVSSSCPLYDWHLGWDAIGVMSSGRGALLSFHLLIGGASLFLLERERRCDERCVWGSEAGG